MEVRTATEDDIEAIREVAHAAWREDYPDVLSRETIESGVSHWYGDAVVRMELSNPGTKMLVAVESETVIGFVHANQAGSVGTILRLHVHPNHRGRGAADALFEGIESALDAADGPLRATVLEANDHVMAFYEDRNFEPVETERTTIGEGQHPEVVLERN